MIEKEFEGQIKINMAENPQDAIEYYAINEIDGVSIVIKEDNSDEE